MTIVIQEYFHERVNDWLNTVGKEVFGITNHWLRYKFAPGHGQIHCHMIAYSNKMKEIRDKMSGIGNKKEKAILLRNFLHSKFGITCNIPTNYDKYEINEENRHPSYNYYSEVKDKKLDATAFLCTTQNHKCSDYCLKRRDLI